jgi:hypothetical protein
MPRCSRRSATSFFVGAAGLLEGELDVLALLEALGNGRGGQAGGGSKVTASL